MDNEKTRIVVTPKMFVCHVYSYFLTFLEHRKNMYFEKGPWLKETIILIRKSFIRSNSGKIMVRLKIYSILMMTLFWHM